MKVNIGNNYIKKKIELERKDTICIIILICVFIVISIRSLFGFDWSDETYYPTSPYKLFLGGELFKDYWNVSQFGDILLMPYIYIYHLFSHNMDGIILFMRFIYNLFNLCIALYLYNTFKNICYNPLLIMAASCIIIFAPFSVGTLSYNTYSLQLLLFSGILISRYIYQKKRRLLVFSGTAYGLAVQMYPGLIFAIFVIPLYLFYNKDLYDLKESRVKRIILWLIGIGIVILIFICYFFYNTSVQSAVENFHRLFESDKIGYENRNINGIQSIINICFQYLSQIINIIGFNAYLIAIITLAIFVLSFCKKFEILIRIEKILYIVLLLLTFSIFIKVFETGEINFINMPLALIGPLLWCINGRESNVCNLIYILGIFESLAIQIGSNNGIIGSAYGLFLSSIAVMIYISIVVHKKNKDFNIRSVSSKDLIIKYTNIIICIVLTSSMLYFRIDNVYRDQKIPDLNARLETGPGKGIYTTQLSKEKYEEICEEIRMYIPEDGTILFSRLLPFGYLMSDLQPATPTTFSAEISSPSLEEYYQVYSEMIPTCVFVIDKNVGIDNDNNPIEGYLGAVLLSGQYDIIKLKYSTVYLKK